VGQWFIHQRTINRPDDSGASPKDGRPRSGAFGKLAKLMKRSEAIIKDRIQRALRASADEEIKLYASPFFSFPFLLPLGVPLIRSRCAPRRDAGRSLSRLIGATSFPFLSLSLSLSHPRFIRVTDRVDSKNRPKQYHNSSGAREPAAINRNVRT